MSFDKDTFNTDSFDEAHEIGLDALDAFSNMKIDVYSGLAALLTVTMGAIEYLAPSKRAADELIDFARNMAKENASRS